MEGRGVLIVPCCVVVGSVVTMSDGGCHNKEILLEQEDIACG